MKYVIATSTYFDLPRFTARKLSDEGPHHLINFIRKELDAEVIAPQTSKLNSNLNSGFTDEAKYVEKPYKGIRGRAEAFLDSIGSKLIGEKGHWQQARLILSKIEDGDVIYSTGQDIGLVIVLQSILKRKKPKLAIFMNDPDNVRVVFFGKIAFKFFPTMAVLVNTQTKKDSVVKKIKAKNVTVLIESTDEEFFTPSKTKLAENDKPLIVSCGLEKRDYKSLAEAMEGLGASTKICAASPNHNDLTRVRMPTSTPDDFEMRLFSFRELRELYRSADVVVIPLQKNNFSAGLTSLLEAIACGAPCVITEESPLVAELLREKLILGTVAENPESIRKAINDVLENKSESAERAKRAREYILSNHSSSAYLDQITKILISVGSTESPVSI